MIYLSNAEPTEAVSPMLDALADSTFDDLSLLISHELRTPLTAIQGVLGLLQSGNLGTLTAEGERLIAIALNNANRLTRLASALEHESAPAITLLSGAEIEQLKLENDLYQALANEQFQLVYQPIMSVNPDQIISFEALLRWHHPSKGIISPAVFIPMAERIGMIQPLGLWVLEQACQQLASWQREFPDQPNLSMSVNLSALQLHQPDFLPQVERILQTTQITPHCLKLEITETSLIENQETAIAILSHLRQMGLQVHIDDFGTGYSSFARLQDLPIDALKIDRSFIGSQRWDICETIITLASKLGLAAIAEGVETVDDLATLQLLGCQYMQGFFFSRPIDSQTATALLATS
jgi:EAL domain-containing protein (putative c-di-GMP-specific phosphodiesterase class I)